MRNHIERLIKEKGENVFIFLNKQENPALHLKKQTIKVPNLAGLYFVFCKEEELSLKQKHLEFKIDNANYILMYFGKAGGETKLGKLLKQGLKKRINNVVSDSHRNLKDIKRAYYWDLIMEEYKIKKLYIIYQLANKPLEIEGVIYSYLKENKLEYPLLNKKLGRKSRKY